MTQLRAEDIAAFLRTTPNFFQEHAELFAQLQVPHPYATQTISLGERQIFVLRDKIKTLETSLHDLIQQARENEKIHSTLTAWCAHMLAEDDATRLPHHIVQYLQTLFDLPNVMLRLWDLPRLPEGEWAESVTPAMRAFVASLSAPTCGTSTDPAILACLPAPPASLTVVPLRHHDTDLGVLILASADAQRFTPEMATDFLAQLGELASAALNRLR